MSDKKQMRAVLVSIDKEQEEYRIRLDDLSKIDGGRNWQQKEHYTSKLYSKEIFEELDFDEKELADFGYSILARLYAFMKRDEL